MRAMVQRPFALGLFGLAAVLSYPTLAQSNSAAAGPSNEELATSALDALESNAATPVDEETEEVTIRGRRTVTEYRLEMEKARDEIVAVFNELNEEGDSDVVCRNERPTGTRMPIRVCRSVAESRAEARAAKDFLNALTRSAGGGRTYAREGAGAGRPVSGVGVPSSGGPQLNAEAGAAGAQGEMVTKGAAARAQLEKELLRLMGESRQLYRAVVKYVELNDEYKAAREGAAE